jgi:hypothetical protein
MRMALEWSRFSPVWYKWPIGVNRNSLANQLQTSLKFRNGLRFQPVDATHRLNRSAGVSKFNVSLGLSFSRLATAFNLFW